jgi:hypothetical protein
MTIRAILATYLNNHTQRLCECGCDSHSAGDRRSTSPTPIDSAPTGTTRPTQRAPPMHARLGSTSDRRVFAEGAAITQSPAIGASPSHQLSLLPLSARKPGLPEPLPEARGPAESRLDDPGEPQTIPSPALSAASVDSRRAGLLKAQTHLRRDRDTIMACHDTIMVSS